MSLGGTVIGKAFNFINDPLGILPSDVYKYMFDPAGIFATQPDVPTTGTPDPDQLVMKSEIGVPVPDLTGTAKITGHLLCFGNERNQAVYSESTGGGKGGGGGGDAQISGYKYFMSWALGFCACPGDSKINTLYAIYKNDDALPVWSGELDCPVSGGQETIVLDGIGSIDFYFGTNDQVANTGVAEIISDPTLNTPYRNMCWAFFDDCYIGEYNRTPTYKFIMKKIPEYPFNDENSTLQKFDVNPANSMYYILSNLAGLPTSWLDSDDFETISETLYSESRGICVLLDRQQSVLSYLESINSHVDNIIRYGADAKFHPKLIRDDYTIGSLPTIDESVMLEDPSFSRGSWIDTVNELKVQYSEIINEDRPGVAKIFILFEGASIDNHSIASVDFDIDMLEYRGDYQSPVLDMKGMVEYDGNLVLTAGNGSTAILQRISGTIVSGSLPLLEEYTPFNDYDVLSSDRCVLIKDDNDKIYYVEDDTGRIVRLNSSLVKEARGIQGTVTLGTDSLKYYHTEGSGWGTQPPPVGYEWSYLEDQLTDSPITSFGVGDDHIVDGLGSSDAKYYDGKIYTVYFASTASAIRILDPSTFAVEANTKESVCFRISVSDGIVHVAHAPTGGSRISSYSASTLAQINSPANLDGAWPVIDSTEDYVIVMTRTSTPDSGMLYKLNPNTHAVIASATILSLVGTDFEYYKMKIMDNRYLVAARNYGLSIFDIEAMTLIDDIDLNDTGWYRRTPLDIVII